VDSSWFEPCPTATEARHAARQLLARAPLPDAVLVDNYYKAEALVYEAEHRGLRVPEDLPVMAYGTEHSGGIRPPLSLLRVPAEEIGHQAASLLHKLIRGSVVPSTQKILQPGLTLRHSCGCAVPTEAETVSPLHEVYA
jgi:DNA-binding LacI/PurR family transcriptional regulator